MKKINIRTRIVISIVAMCASSFVYSQSSVSFPDADLNGSDGLLFTAEATRGNDTWKNLYKTTITQDANALQASTGGVKLLNCFPKKLDSLQGGRFLQVRNADGTFMYSVGNKTLTELSQNSIFASTLSNDARARDNIIETSVSPDGNWMSYFKKRSPAKAFLMLTNTQTGEEIILNDSADFSFDDLPVLWSADSSVLLYEKQGKLYFFDVENISELNLIEEKYRLIGEGSINNISWASDKQLIYIQDDIVFSISINELYTRALYSDILGSGEIVGRLPWDYSGTSDRFWVDESGTQLIIMQNENSLFYFQIEEPYAALAQKDTGIFSRSLFSQAFVPIADSALDLDVLWVPSEKTSDSVFADAPLSTPLLWLGYSGKINESYVYRLNKSRGSENIYFEQLNVPKMASEPSLSPDKKTLAFTAVKSDANATEETKNDRYLYVYDLASWAQQYVFVEENVVSFQWKSNSSIFVGGSQTVRQWDFIDNRLTVLFLSSINRFAWDESGTKILSSNNAGTFEYVEKTNTWITSDIAINRSHSQMNAYWRIVSTEGRGGRYSNLLFVRALQGESQNKPLLTSVLSDYSTRPKVSFAFDALDNRDGLVHVLDSLSEYGLVGSFFVNGEFLKRFPESVVSIVDRGHEVAPMFYTSVDLLSDGFVIDESFIRRGLANNEDAFFALTGVDMQLYWHPPYYKSSDLIKDAGAKAGYRLVENILSINDTVTIESAAENSYAYDSSAQVIENLIPMLYDGAIIPISIGVGDGKRNDYVYEKMDILINAIYEAGYAIEPVSKLIF